MSNIILISTVHTERGRCNAEELFKIIESIDPEVIFEELPAKLFDIVYRGHPMFDEVLEIKCIRKYLVAHDIKYIPVDIEFAFVSARFIGWFTRLKLPCF